MVKRYISLLLNSSLYMVVTSCGAVSYKDRVPVLPQGGKRGMMEEADRKRTICLGGAVSLFLFYRILAFLNSTFKFSGKKVNFF